MILFFSPYTMLYIVSLVVVLIILWMDVPHKTPTEAFEPHPETLALSLMNTLQTRGIQFAPGGLQRISLIERSVGTPVQESMWTMIFGRQPAFSTTTTFRLSFETKGSDSIVRSQVITVRGVGESREESRRDSEEGVRQVVDAVRALSRSRGYI